MIEKIKNLFQKKDNGAPFAIIGNILFIIILLVGFSAKVFLNLNLFNNFLFLSLLHILGLPFLLLIYVALFASFAFGVNGIMLAIPILSVIAGIYLNFKLLQFVGIQFYRNKKGVIIIGSIFIILVTEAIIYYFYATNRF